MKPRYLEFCGINSFSEPAKIDFTDLLQYGIFGIFGDTGSGKSTILDCISFALYGGTPRVRAGAADLINYRSERAYVIFEFEIFHEGVRKVFRVERELKRKNASHTARVIECGEGIVRAEGVREVKSEIEKIIGLEQRDFEKCIALPQGEFAQFVKEQRSERLKIVSRLFDLEEYGERLVLKSSANYRENLSRWEVAKARLEPFSSFTEERNKALEEELKGAEERLVKVRSDSEGARAREFSVAEKFRKRQEAERVKAQLSRLAGSAEEISALKRTLSLLPVAAEVRRAQKEHIAAEDEVRAAQALCTATQQKQTQAAAAAASCARWDEEKADGEIASLTEQRARAEQAERDGEKRRALEAQLLKARKAYAAEAESFGNFSYEEERRAIEQKLSAAGEQDFLSYAGERLKGALLGEEYRRFAAELSALLEKHPAAEEDIRPLIEKYSRLTAGEKVDFSALKQGYEEQQRGRREAQEALIALEKRNGAYCAHRQKLQQLQSEGLRIRDELSALPQESGATLTREEIDGLLAKLRKEKKAHAEEREAAARAQLSANAAHAAATEKLRAAKSNEVAAKERLGSALSRGSFAGIEEAEALLVRFGDPAGAEERVQKYEEEVAALKDREREFSGQDLSEGTSEAVEEARKARIRLESEGEALSREVALKRAELERGREALAQKRALEKEEQRLCRETQLSERLKKLFEGNKFMEFIAEEYLQNVAGSASARLLSLTGGKYFLRYEGGFLVGDNLNGGKLRGVHTLSGGELFLVSLSLALALSAEICAKSSRPIEFFFLDEGFGTLDERLVDTVMDSLEKLRGEHFAIGIISHVEELKHRIEKKLFVEKATDKHGSAIHV